MHRSAKLVVVTSFCWVAALGCGQGVAVNQDFTDRQILEGVVFGSGPLASVLPEARDHLRPELYVSDQGELAAMSDARARLIDAVESAQPGFVAEFARAARSGNPATVRAMLARAVQVVNQTSVRGAPGNLPVADVRGNLPVADVRGNLPVADVRGNLPVADVRGNLPVADVRGNLPVADVRGNLPVADVRGNLPVADVRGNLPVAGVRGNLPVAGVRGNLPVAGVRGNLPVADVRGNLPVADVRGNLPVADVRGNLPVADVRGNLPVADVRGNLPVAGVRGNLPVADVTVAPAWALFNNRLFSEQLANSVAMTLERPASGER